MRRLVCPVVILAAICVGCGKRSPSAAGKNSPLVPDSAVTEPSEPDDVPAAPPASQASQADATPNESEEPKSADDASKPVEADSSEPENKDESAKSGTSEFAQNDSANVETDPSEQTDPSDPTSVSEPDATANDTGDEAAETEELPPAHRMFLPTTAGPLLVDVEIRLAEELLADEFDGRITKLMEDAKGDADQLTWEESLFLHFR